jgi:hypothetical protein
MFHAKLSTKTTSLVEHPEMIQPEVYVPGTTYYHFEPKDKSLHRKYDFYIWLRAGTDDNDFASKITPEVHTLLVGCAEPTITTAYDTLPTVNKNAKKFVAIEYFNGATSNVFTITNPNYDVSFCRIVSHSITIVNNR